MELHNKRAICDQHYTVHEIPAGWRSSECPACGAFNEWDDNVEWADDNYAVYYRKCQECNARWHEHYERTKVVIIDVPDTFQWTQKGAKNE